MDYVIKNGTVCLEGEHFRADVTVREGKIQALGKAVHNGHEKSSTPMASMSALAASMLIPIWTCSNRRSIAPVMTFTAAALRRLRRHDDHPGPYGLWAGRLFPALSFEQYKKLAAPCPVDYSFHGVIQHVDDQSCENWASSSTKGFPASRPIRRMAILSVKEN
mgnify:CR=1 FL=1